jgi:hypothetical protein
LSSSSIARVAAACAFSSARQAASRSSSMRGARVWATFDPVRLEGIHCERNKDMCADALKKV